MMYFEYTLGIVYTTLNKATYQVHAKTWPCSRLPKLNYCEQKKAKSSPCSCILRHPCGVGAEGCQVWPVYLGNRQSLAGHQPQSLSRLIDAATMVGRPLLRPVRLCICLVHIRHQQQKQKGVAPSFGPILVNTRTAEKNVR